MRRKYFKRLKNMDTLQVLMQLPRSEFERAIYELATKQCDTLAQFQNLLMSQPETLVIDRIKSKIEYSKY